MQATGTFTQALGAAPRTVTISPMNAAAASAAVYGPQPLSANFTIATATAPTEPITVFYRIDPA